MIQQRLLRILAITTIALAGWTIQVSTQSATVPAPQTGAGAGAGTAGQAPGAPGAGQARGPLAPVVIGPSAPVPPEVAMLRPTSAEIAQINDALRKFISADKSAASPLLKKYESVVMVQPPRLNTAATYTQTVQRMGPRHQGFVEIAKRGNIDLLLDGDSITDF